MPDRPAADEVEITLLGRGVGESIVVHLTADEWMIVDSFEMNSEPAAQTYLESMGIPVEHIRTLVITHFDRDHFVGIDKLVDHYPNARLEITRALRQPNFMRIYGIQDEDNDYPTLFGALERARRRRIAPHISGLRDLKCGQLLREVPPIRVMALSPTESAVEVACAELARAIDSLDPGNVKSQLSRDNRCSVVLHISAGCSAILLGGDLERAPQAFGWGAVLEEPDHRYLQRSNLVKVPHHGSDGAHYAEMWNALVEEQPWIIVAPFWNNRIPGQDDIQRLQALGRAVYQAAPSEQLHSVDEFGNSWSQPAVTGGIRARRGLNEPRWRLDVMEPGFLCT